MTSQHTKMEIQKLLKEAGLYNGYIDGKFGPETYKGIKALAKTYSVDCTDFSERGKTTLAEQIFFSIRKIDAGKLDGLESPQLQYARDVYNAQLVTTWRDAIDAIQEANARVPASKIPTQPKPRYTFEKQNSSIWPRERDLTSFYGKVGTNQTDCILPYQMVLAWQPKTKINKFSCHRKAKEPFERIFGRTLDHYGYEKIKELKLHYWGGCLNVRKKRGGSSWSVHSWGVAIDLDPDNNQLRWGRDRATFARPAYKKFWEFVYDEGGLSLGIEKNYDYMHFQLARF